MKLVLEIKNKPQKNDILLYNGREWECISTSEYLNRVTLLQKAFEEREKEHKKELETLKNQLNEKLEEHHKVLQLLVKGDK